MRLRRFHYHPSTTNPSSMGAPKIIIISALQKTDADIEAKWKSMWRPVPQGDALCQLV